MTAVSPAQADVAHPHGGEGLWSYLYSPRQIIKLVVYTLLLINFVQYVINDITAAVHTAHDGWRWWDWTAAFATTMDELAWFTLLLLFELETFLLSDEAFTKTRVRIMQGLRILCFLFIGHTVFAFAEYTNELTKATDVAATDLCALAGEELSFARNLEYTELTEQSCSQLDFNPPLIRFDQGQLVTDAAGFQVEWGLAIADILEVVVWLFILFFIELMVRIQEKGVTTGPLIRTARVSKGVLYGLLWLVAAYWASLGHWVFAWDEACWILGFMAIDMNLSDWRKEIEAEDAATANG